MLFRTERPERRKAIPGYEGKYEVGDLGRVYSRGCELVNVGGRYVKLSKGGAVERMDVAYLVARAFIPNVEGRLYVRHKDGDNTNNRVENLEWVERKPKHGGGRPAEKVRPVLQYTLGGRCIARYENLTDAAKRTGVARSLIAKCADGAITKTHGYRFRYD